MDLGWHVSHVTLGYYYSEDGSGRSARQVLRELREREVGAIEVGNLTLVKAPWSGGLYHLEPVSDVQLTR